MSKFCLKKGYISFKRSNDDFLIQVDRLATFTKNTFSYFDTKVQTFHLNENI